MSDPSPADAAERRLRPGPRRRAAVGLAALVLCVAAVVGLLVGIVALGALVPGAGAPGDTAPLIVPVWGPALFVLGLLATALAWLVRGLLRRSATGVAIGCAVSTAALGAVLGVVVTAVIQGGGAVDPLRALVPLSSASPRDAPDERPVFTTTREGRALHVAVWRPRPRAVPAPIFVYLHGGGWIGGSELGRSAELRGLADGGWLAVSVEYSFAREGRPTWNVAGPEVACALAEVAADAGRHHADPTRIALAGDSAGGQLAISVAYHAASATQVSSCGGAVPVPRAVATDYPAADLVDGYRHGATGGPPSLDARYLATVYTGGTPEQVPDHYRAVSGAAALTAAAPPTLVIAPSRDALVPPAGLARFVQAARAGGVDAQLVRVPVANHAFDQLRNGSLGQQAGWSLLEHWAAGHVR